MNDNSNPNYNNNYTTMKNTIEPRIFTYIELWLSQPDFFLDVVNNINQVLTNFTPALNIIFDGNNIIFNNDLDPKYIIINGEKEIAYGLSQEYKYDIINKTVYRTPSTFNNMLGECAKWINKTNNYNNLGVSVNKLLRYLRILGDEFIKLYNNFTDPLIDTPDFFYNSPLKFIIARLWEKYSKTNNLSKLDKEFTDNLTIISQFEIKKNKAYSYLQFDESINISYYGLLNYAKALDWAINGVSDVNINDVIVLEPYGNNIVNIVNTLQINPIYKYKLNVNNEINVNSTYSFDFLFGNNLPTVYI